MTYSVRLCFRQINVVLYDSRVEAESPLEAAVLVLDDYSDYSTSVYPHSGWQEWLFCARVSPA